MKIKNVPINGKVMLVIAVFGAIFIGSTGFSARELRQTAEGYDAAISRQGKTALFVARGNTSLMQARAAIGDLLVSNTDEGNRRALDELATARKEFIGDMETADQAALDTSLGIKELAAKGVKAIDVVCKTAIDMGTVATTPEPILASQAIFLQTCSPALFDVSMALTPIARQAAAEQEALTTDLAGASQRTVTITYAAAFGSLISVGLIGFFAIRAWVSRPIKDLAAAMMQLASGDLAVAIEETERRDEVGLMAQSLQVFKDNGLKARDLEHEATKMRDTAEVARRRSAAETAQRAAEQAEVVASITQGLENLSNGALTFRIAHAFAADYDKLRVNFNAAMKRLQDTIIIVANNTSAIRSGTGEISSAADDLSLRAEQQAASLEETAAALDEITATVRKTADGSKHVRDVVAATKQGAEHSGRIVRQAIEAMTGIERSSVQIGRIIGVIDEIAFQTNLLALNAGIEAARAGDAGRGFAVVASEVRALAQRSADAAKEIKVLISASSVQVEQGVDLVGQTGKALERIVEQVTEINGFVGEIAASAQEQATGLAQVNTAVNQMDQVTQQNVAMVEESTAASHALSKETEELSRLIAGFEVGRGTAAPLPRSAIQRSGSRPALAGLKTHPAMKTSSRDGAARKFKPEAEQQDWQEF